MSQGGPEGGDGLLAELRAAVPDGVDHSVRRLAEYAADASNYRHVPRAVVFPSDAAQVAATVAVARAHGVGVTMRGGGTSIGGSAIGPGVVLDCSRRYGRILEIDPASATARVEPGVVLDDLRAAAAVHGLTFGPDPSTHGRATLGGMLGNNACGSRSMAWGRTVDNVRTLDVLLADGTRLTVGPTPPEELAAGLAAGGRRAELYAGLIELRDRHLAGIRAGLGRFARQASGYALEHLLPERGFDLARALVGTEGTCAVVLGATLRLVPLPGARALLVLGFDDLAEGADAVPAILPLRPLACEGLDDALVPPGSARAVLPPGEGWLLVEFGGPDAAGAIAAAQDAATALAGVAGLRGVRVVGDQAAQRALWRIRDDGAGRATRLPPRLDGPGRGLDAEAWPGWEDVAVPPERLGGYLRAFRELMARHGRRGILYGHFGEGCLHVRIDFDFLTAAGVRGFRAFVTDAADLAAAYGGSLSGEHGDGQARSELLARIYPPELISAFAEFKAAWDPEGLLNPGIVVRPRPVDADLRVVGPRRTELPVVFAYSGDGGDLARAARRCVGVAKCRTDVSAGGVMCPSYRATGDEKDSTRGRARVLQEMLRGELITDGWRSTEVLEALDLCLSCKGCRSDCPVGVDVATYKAEFLHHHYEGRVRPAAHYSMGWLPVWARLAGAAPRAVNALARQDLTGRLIRRAGGITDRRPLPAFAPAGRRALPRVVGPADGPRVALWVDTFTAAFAPGIASAALDVLAAAGLRVHVAPGTPCCGLTWVTSGQLGVARRVLRRTLDVLAPAAAAGMPVVALEPSCAATLRSDLPELLPDDPRSAALADATVTLAGALGRLAPGWRPPHPLARVPVVSQVHCHQHAVLSYAAEAELLDRWVPGHAVLDAGCCGLAGGFGFEREHYDLSVAVAEAGLLPALGRAGPDAVVVADGFSCRTQLAHLTDRRVVHLAELLRTGLSETRPGSTP